MHTALSSQDDDSSSQFTHHISNPRKKRPLSGHVTGSMLRLALVMTLVTTGVFISFLNMGSHVHAAALTTTHRAQHTTTATTQTSSSTLTGAQKFNQLLLQLAATYTSAPQTKTHTATPQTVKPMTTSYSYNGLGDVPFYTYVDKKSLTDQVSMKVNVANGNVLLNTSELKLAGTGLNVSVGSDYNSEENPSALLDDGNLWYFNTGRGVTLDLSNVASGITLHGPSGYSTFFAADSSKSNGFDTAIGMHAYIAATGSGTYTVTFQQTGEQWGFNQYGAFLLDGDKNGNSIQYSYGGNGDLNTITDTQGRTITFTHGTDSGNNLHQVTGYTISTTDGTSKTISHGYTAFALTSLTNADLKTTNFHYDSVGRITKITDPLSQSTSFAYNTSGQIATITDAKTGTTTFAYHASTDSACSNIVPSPGTALPCTVVTDQNSHSTTYAYNPSLQVTYVKDALGHTSAQAFDSTSYNVQSTTDALNNQTTFGYDTNNNMKSSKDATGATSSATYTSIANAYYSDTQTDAQGNGSTSSYDGSGNLTSQTDTSSQNTLKYRYNANGTVATQSDPDQNPTATNGHQISYGYDSHGNMTTVTPTAPLGATTMTYDQLSRLKTETDGNGHTTTFTYDKEDRITTIAYSGTPTPSVSYTYDGNGNALTEVDGTGTTTFTYDALNRELTKTLPSTTVITNAYDGVGNLTSLNDGTGTTTYTYNAANLMDTLTAPGGGVSHYGYDSNNHRTCIIYPNSTGMLLTFDNAGREVTNTGGTISSSTCSGSPTVSTPMTGYSYNYGTAPNTKEVMQSAVIHAAGNYSSSATSTYTYDSQNRLKGVSTPTQTWGQTYDANGNLLTRTYTGASTYSDTFSYNNANELTSASNTGTGSGSATYSYDNNGNLTGVTNGASGPGALTSAQTHTYTTSNQDTSGTGTATGSSSSYTYGYSGTDQTDRVSNNSNPTVYTSLGLSSEKTSATTSNEYVRCSCGMLNSERTSAGQVYYYLFDGLGSIVGMTDSSGALVATYGYDAFGNVGGGTVQSGLVNPWGYAGGYTDKTTGLIKFGIRYYDAHTGRWTQATPIGGSLQEATKANPYEYAGNNPVNNVDPSGENWWSGFQGCLGSVGSVISGAVATLGGLIGGITVAVGGSQAASAASAIAWATIAEDTEAIGYASFAAAGAASTIAVGGWIVAGAAAIGVGILGTCAIISAVNQ